MPAKSLVYTFANCMIFEREFLLLKDGQTVAVEPKSFRVLLVLLRYPNKVISKEELLTAVWGDVAVTENSLTRAIATLRRLLDDDAREPQFIETVTTVGYRWICPVEQHEDSERTEPSIAGPSPHPLPKRRAIVMGAGLAVTAIVLLGAVWYLLRPLPPPRIAEYNQITHDGHRKSLAGTDGSRVFFNLWSSNAFAQVGVTGGEGPQISIPVSGAVVGAIDVSPDGSSFLVGSGISGFDTLWKVRILGGSVRNLGHFSQAAAFSPDGNWIAYAIGHDGIYVMRSSGMEPRKVTAYPEDVPYSLSWSPDGKAIQFEQAGKIWEASTSGEGGVHPFFHGWQAPGDVCCGRWTADGSYFLFMVADQIWALDRRQRLSGISPAKPVPLTSPPLRWAGLVPGKDATKIFAIGSTLRGELTRYNAETKVFSPLVGGVSAEFVDYSPDAKSILYVSYPDGILWKAGRDGDSPVQLTEAGYYPINPRWSPDGTQICFASDFPGKVAGYIVSAGGGNPRRILPEGSGPQGELNWSPDGKRILYAHYADTPEGQNLSILDLANGQVAILPGSVGFSSPRWSRDGRFIAALAPAPPILRLFDFQTQTWRALPVQGGVDFPSFSRDGQSIFFYRRNDREQGFYRVSLNDGRAQQVVDLKDWHLTGKFGFWAGLDDSDSPLLLRDIGSSDIYALTLGH